MRKCEMWIDDQSYVKESQVTPEDTVCNERIGILKS
jgi:hypothetical protein